MIRPRLFIIMLIVALLLAACRQNSGGEVPTPTFTPLQLEILQAIADWETAGIDDYTMQVTYRRGGWNPQVLDVTVTGGEAVVDSHTCFPQQNCFVRTRELEGEDFSLASIFAQARTLTERNTLLHVVYNEEYGFPRIIQTTEGSWEISNFQPAGDG